MSRHLHFWHAYFLQIRWFHRLNCENVCLRNFDISYLNTIAKNSRQVTHDKKETFNYVQWELTEKREIIGNYVANEKVGEIFFRYWNLIRRNLTAEFQLQTAEAKKSLLALLISDHVNQISNDCGVLFNVFIQFQTMPLSGDKFFLFSHDSEPS